MSKYTESFESYAGSIRGSTTFKDVFNHQQSKIDELLKRLTECEDALGFYAEEGNWYWESGDSNKTQNIIEDIDVQYCSIFRDGVGGKRARAYFKKYEGKNG